MSSCNLIIDKAQSPKACLILAHGAGAPMDSDFMCDFASGLQKLNISVVRFEFPYMAQRRTGGTKRPPNKMAELIDSFESVISEVGANSSLQNVPLFIGGKSMGGRVATMLESNVLDKVSGIVALGYPFHPQGKPEKLRTEHLGSSFDKPTIIVQGDRDALGSKAEIESYSLSCCIQTVYLGDGDHSFKPRVKSGFTLTENYSVAFTAINDFISAQLKE